MWWTWNRFRDVWCKIYKKHLDIVDFHFACAVDIRSVRQYPSGTGTACPNLYTFVSCSSNAGCPPVNCIVNGKTIGFYLETSTLDRL